MEPRRKKRSQHHQVEDYDDDDDDGDGDDDVFGNMEPRRRKRSQHHQVRNGDNCLSGRNEERGGDEWHRFSMSLPDICHGQRPWRKNEKYNV